MSLPASFAFASGLVALDSVVDRMGDNLRGEPLRWNPSSMITFGLFLAAGILASWLWVRFAGYHDWRVRCNSPWRLFLVLCRAHRLRWSDRWLLWRLSQQRSLEDPGDLFLEPRHLDLESLPAAWRRHAARLEGLRKRLYAGLTTSRPQEPTHTPSALGDELRRQSQPRPIAGADDRATRSSDDRSPRQGSQGSQGSQGIQGSDRARRPSDTGPPPTFPLGAVPQLDLPPWNGQPHADPPPRS